MNSYSCWLLTWLLMCSHTSSAVETSAPPMRLALGYLPPINCEDSKVGTRCINNKIVQRLQHFSGIDIQTRLVPYARAARMLQSNQADMGLMLKNNNMPSNVIAVAKVFEINLSVYTRVDADHLPYNQLRIGVLRGQGNNIIKHLEGANLIELAEYRQGVEMIALGRLDAILGPDEILVFLIDQHQLNNMLSPRPLLQFGQEVWLYCRKDACNAQRLRQLKQAVTDIQPEIPTIKQVIPAAYYE